MEIKNKQTGKKFVLSMLFGLMLTSAAAFSASAFADDLSPAQSGDASDAESLATTATQSITDGGADEETLRATYGGCGLSCAGCSLRCF